MKPGLTLECLDTAVLSREREWNAEVEVKLSIFGGTQWRRRNHADTDAEARKRWEKQDRYLVVSCKR